MIRVAQSPAVHIWSVTLGVSDRDMPALRSVVSPAERERAAGMVTPALTRRYLAAHAALRCVLASDTGCHPGELAFASGPAGKPRVIGQAADDVRFNLSHSGDRALVAVTRAREVGVDIEVVRPLDTLELLIARACTPQEARECAESAADRNRAFFRCWTRKEAYVKALGIGLADALPHASVAPGWSIQDISIATDCIAAVAIQRPHGPVTCHPEVSASDLVAGAAYG